ncbi:hypothetical protein [Rossellomorea vietnamensis]|uniref:hypothetical protein n=1 Tax=Rossellomorea vietnamensis TaxID=218284 RepID=UPI000553C4CF|nr:hypothetical protein [Rossellomorea vietnamensis]OXS62141.1 hypothetical protein B1B00_07750 [Bacillus sp. DSM 27956]PRX77448.1 hypothetical protein B0G93_105145 [Bacillus sp. V-88]SLK20249.1 hypothetical protein SAMN06295884_105145 [Bacillus sp. V-88]
MKASQRVMIAGLLITILLSGCNRNAADMVVNGSVKVNEEAETLTFSGVLTDEALEPETPFRARFFLQGKTIKNALGTDLIYTDEELKSRKEGEDPKEYKVEKTVEIKKIKEIDKVISEIKDEDKESVTIEIVNDNGRIDDKVLHDIEKE